MDDRYLYFALADPDYFDVPWAIEETQPVALEGQLPDDWTITSSGPWQLFAAPGVSLPRAGWKLHVSMTPEDASRVLPEVARTCVRHGACFKTLRGARLIRASHLKYTPASISGKVATIYPTTTTELAALVDELGEELHGIAAPTFPGETNHPSAPLGVRWGSFIENWVEAPDGRTVPGVRRDDAEVEPDSRSEKKPLPSEIERAFNHGAPAEPLPITQAALLHRSNAGGVYRARLDTGEPVVLKEARHHTGLDAGGVDAVSRLRHEYAVLQRLRGTGVAPDPIDYWRRDDADFLVMEAIEGPTMVKAVGRNHPRGRPDVTSDDRAAFADWADGVTSHVRKVVDTLHDAGVAHGDVQPGNIILSTDGVRFVDFESASLDGAAVSTTLGTPGFIGGTMDQAERDLLAVERLSLMLREPDALLLDRRPDLEPVLNGAEAPVALDSTARTHWTSRLTEGLLSRSTPQRPDRLFPGGIEQFTVPLGARNLASGAAGVLLTLRHLGLPIMAEHLDWLADLPETAVDCRGLGEGVDGIAVALALLGRPDQASRIADALLTRPQPRGLSWSCGRTGVAVALAELSSTLNRDDLRRAATTLCESILRDVESPDHTVPGPGLQYGWSGIALGVQRVAELLDLDVGDGPAHAVRREFALLEQRGDCLISAAGGRLRSGIGHGSAAAVLALAAIGTTDSALLDAQHRAGLTTERMTAPLGGLYDGLVGDFVVLRVLDHHDSADDRLRRATWHCVRTERGWSTLGAQRLRCSDDVATGTSGVLLALSEDPLAGLAGVLRLPHLVR